MVEVPGSNPGGPTKCPLYAALRVFHEKQQFIAQKVLADFLVSRKIKLPVGQGFFG